MSEIPEKRYLRAIVCNEDSLTEVKLLTVILHNGTIRDFLLRTAGSGYRAGSFRRCRRSHDPGSTHSTGARSGAADIIINQPGLCVSPVGWTFFPIRRPGYEYKETLETGAALRLPAVSPTCSSFPTQSRSSTASHR